MRKLIKKAFVYFLTIKVIIMMIVIIVDRKQIKELKNKYQTSINEVDSLYRTNVDPSILWFENQVPENYEVMEHAIMSYDWGKEVVIFFKYKENETL
jgi:predicted Holliday junction resolvase-like endonuclease